MKTEILKIVQSKNICVLKLKVRLYWALRLLSCSAILMEETSVLKVWSKIINQNLYKTFFFKFSTSRIPFSTTGRKKMGQRWRQSNILGVGITFPKPSEQLQGSGATEPLGILDLFYTLESRSTQKRFSDFTSIKSPNLLS